LLERLDELETIFGVHATAQLSLRASGPKGPGEIRRVVAQLLNSPPTSLGSLAVSEVVDLSEGWRGLEPSEGVWMGLGPFGRVVVRPSGTEAKVKAYVEVTPKAAGTLDDQRARGGEMVAGVVEDLAVLLRL
jgi:phosphomannomutase